MPLNDHLVRIITASGTVRALACTTTNLVREGAARHHAGPVASAALGRALTGGALMGALLKSGQRVALKFEGNGPLKKVIVEAESNGAVRGFVAVPDVDLPLRDGKLDVAGGIGRAGFLTVTKDLGLKDPYKGIVQLYSSEIAEDLAYYLTDSEQTPSAVGLSVFVDSDNAVTAAGGFLIQAMPPGDPALVDTLMARIEELPPLSELFLAGTTPEALLERLFREIPYTLLEQRVLAFSCSCSREKIERALISIGKEELGRLAAEQEATEVTCEFCQERYTFERQEVRELLTTLDQEGTPC